MKNPYLDMMNREQKRKDRINMITGFFAVILCFAAAVWIIVSIINQAQKDKNQQTSPLYENQR